MSVLADLSAYRKAVLGAKVDRATAVLPATTQSAIFTVAGGRVLVTSLVGEVTVIMGATVTTLKITANPTVGTDVDLTTATAVTSKEVGSLISLPPISGGALTVNSAGGTNQLPNSAYLIPVGTIDLVTSATDTGSIKWSITYLPLDDGASITAA